MRTQLLTVQRTALTCEPRYQTLKETPSNLPTTTEYLNGCICFDLPQQATDLVTMITNGLATMVTDSVTYCSVGPLNAEMFLHIT